MKITTMPRADIKYEHDASIRTAGAPTLPDTYFDMTAHVGRTDIPGDTGHMNLADAPVVIPRTKPNANAPTPKPITLSDQYTQVLMPETAIYPFEPVLSERKILKEMFQMMEAVPLGKQLLDDIQNHTTHAVHYYAAFGNPLSDSISSKIDLDILEPKALTLHPEFNHIAKHEGAHPFTKVLITLPKTLKSKNKAQRHDALLHEVRRLYHETRHAMSFQETNQHSNEHFSHLEEEFQAYAEADRFFTQLIEKFPLSDPRNFSLETWRALANEQMLDINGGLARAPTQASGPFAPLDSPLTREASLGRVYKELLGRHSTLPSWIKLGAIPFSAVGDHIKLVLPSLQSFDVRMTHHDGQYGQMHVPNNMPMFTRNLVDQMINKDWAPRTIFNTLIRVGYEAHGTTPGYHVRAQEMQNLMDTLEQSVGTGKEFSGADLRELVQGLRLPVRLDALIKELVNR